MSHTHRIAVALLGAALLLLTGCSRETATAPSERRGIAVAAVELTPRDLSRQLVVSAPVVPYAHIKLASRTSGTVLRVQVEEGDRVAAGDLLAELDMAEARAELARADAEEERARLDYQRLTELRERGVASPAEYQQSRANLRVAESERALWRTRVSFGRILAPESGVITARHIEPGEAVQQQDTLFELAAMDQLVIRPGLSELDVVHLLPGQPVRIRLDALPDLQLAGQVRRIFPMATSGSRLVTVEIALPEDAAERGVRPGFLARLELSLDQRKNALAVPSSAIGETEDGRYVYVIEDNRLHQRAVSIGATRGQWTEITDGLESGEIVLASNPIDMQDGQAVRIVGWRG